MLTQGIKMTYNVEMDKLIEQNRELRKLIRFRDDEIQKLRFELSRLKQTKNNSWAVIKDD